MTTAQFELLTLAGTVLPKHGKNYDPKQIVRMSAEELDAELKVMTAWNNLPPPELVLLAGAVSREFYAAVRDEIAGRLEPLPALTREDYLETRRKIMEARNV